MKPELTADEVLRKLALVPHPEGGFYRETWRDRAASGARGAGTAIYFLLRAGDRHRWHRIDAAEIWHHYSGAPLELEIAVEGARVERRRLSDELDDSSEPQIVVPAGAWQRARSLGDWTLVGCTVSPAFEFGRFEIAPEGWEPR